MDHSTNTEQVLTLLSSLTYAYVPEDMVETIAKLPRTKTLESLRDIVLTVEGELSDRAIDAILQIDPNYGKSILLDLWNRSSWEWFFCYSAPRYDDASFVRPLCEILLKSPKPTTRHTAAWALVHVGNADAIEALTMALDDPGEDYEGRKISTQAEEALKAIDRRMSE